MVALLAAAGTWHAATALGVGYARVADRLETPAIRVPGYIVVLVLTTAAKRRHWLSGGDHRQPLRRYRGHAPAHRVPNFRADLILTLLSPALTIAMLGSVESLLSAVVADRLAAIVTTRTSNSSPRRCQHRLAMVGGLRQPALARTATNIRSVRGLRFGMIHALTLLPCCWWRRRAVRAGHARRHPADGGVSDGRVGRDSTAAQAAEADIAVWVVTFGLTVFADPTVAVETA